MSVFLYFDNGIEQVSADKPRKTTLSRIISMIEDFPPADEVPGSYLGLISEGYTKIQLIRAKKHKWLLELPVYNQDKFKYTRQVDGVHTEAIKHIVKKIFYGQDFEEELSNLTSTCKSPLDEYR